MFKNPKETYFRAFSDTSDGSNRIGQDCSKEDIVVFQGSTAPLPNGVPAYTVEIVNSCVSDCSIAEIHVSCGWFSSVRLVNPRVFRRLSYDDCLVNDGEPLGPGQTLSLFNMLIASLTLSLFLQSLASELRENKK